MDKRLAWNKDERYMCFLCGKKHIFSSRTNSYLYEPEFKRYFHKNCLISELGLDFGRQTIKLKCWMCGLEEGDINDKERTQEEGVLVNDCGGIPTCLRCIKARKKWFKSRKKEI